MFPWPPCQLCGALVADEAKHQRFHDALAAIWQEAFGLSDEEAGRIKREILQGGSAPGPPAAPAGS